MSELVNELQQPSTPTEPTTAPETEPVKTEAAPEPDPFSARFSKLVEAEQKARREREQLKASLEERDDFQEWRRIRNSGNIEDKLKFLGTDYDSITKHVVGTGKVGAEAKISEVETQLQRLQREIAERDAQLQKAREQEVVRHYQEDLMAAARSNAAFELTAAVGDKEEIYRLQEAHYNATGEVMEQDELLKNYEELLSRRYQPLLKTSKFRKLFESSQPKPSNPPQTLTNDLSANTTADSLAGKSLEERIRILSARPG